MYVKRRKPYETRCLTAWITRLAFRSPRLMLSDCSCDSCYLSSNLLSPSSQFPIGLVIELLFESPTVILLLAAGSYCDDFLFVFLLKTLFGGLFCLDSSTVMLFFVPTSEIVLVSALRDGDNEFFILRLFILWFSRWALCKPEKESFWLCICLTSYVRDFFWNPDVSLLRPP